MARVKAVAAWQWYNYSCAGVAASAGVLRINFDETAICLFQGAGRGNVFVRKSPAAMVQNVTRGRTRTYLTHVAFLCDDRLVQQVLPQIVIGNEKTIPLGQLVALRGACPNVKLLRRNTSWITGDLCVQIIRWLSAALAPVRGDRRVILLFDACRMHLGAPVFRACAAQNIKPVVVPAQMTWLLQPLDTHAFYAYKVHLQKAYQARRIASDSGTVGLAELLGSVSTAIQDVLCTRDWGHAFDGNGFSNGQTDVSSRVTSALGLLVSPAVAASKPTAEQVAACFPRRSRVPTDAIWAVVPKAAAAPLSPEATVGRRASARIVAAKAKAVAATSSHVALPSAPSSSSSAWTGPITRARARAAASGT